MSISWEDFKKVDLKSGMIIKAWEFFSAKKPVYKIWVDFSPEISVRQTLAQVTKHYTPESLTGRSIVGCVNLGERNIAEFIS